MIASATQRNIRSLMRHPTRLDKLNILTFTTHERYEYNLCKTGHEFYAINYGKSWDKDYSEIPENYHILHELPSHIDFDLILSHTSCNRIQIAHDILSETSNQPINRLAIPILRHTHVLPDIRYNVQEQIQSMKSVPVYKNSFISNYNRIAWGYSSNNAHVIEHGIDTNFWRSHGENRQNLCLSVVNDWPNRDWCCGFNLWKNTTKDLPVFVVGKSPGFSNPAQSIEHLRSIYSSSKIFYNTSLHSPVPTVLLEAMACGCAIVSTATCMIPEIIEHGYNGLISNDPVELRKNLELLLSDDELAKQLGDNARKTIEDKFNIDIFCNKWNDLFFTTIEQFKGKQ